MNETMPELAVKTIKGNKYLYLRDKAKTLRSP